MTILEHGHGRQHAYVTRRTAARVPLRRDWDDDQDDLHKLLAHHFPEHLENEPQKEIHPRSGYSVHVGEEKRLVVPQTEGKTGERPGLEWSVTDHGHFPNRPMFPSKDVRREPVKHVYRGVSTDEWKQAQERGHIQSDKRGTIADWEGTNADVDPRSAASYLPRGGSGHILQIKVHPDDGWFTHHADQYVRTRQSIPLDRVTKISPVIHKDEQTNYSVDEEHHPNQKTAAKPTPGFHTNVPPFDGPHHLSLKLAQNIVRDKHPDLAEKMPSNPDPLLKHILGKGGHPDAADGFVMKHEDPKASRSQAVYGLFGQPGIALHPDRWDYGTLAHEAAHLLHHHHGGINYRKRGHPDEVKHGPDFVDHYRTALNAIAHPAGELLHDQYHKILPNKLQMAGTPLGEKLFRKAVADKGTYFHGTSLGRARSIIDNGAYKGINLSRHRSIADDYARIGEKHHDGGAVLEGDLVGSEDEHYREPWGVVTSRPGAFVPRRLHHFDGRVEEVRPEGKTSGRTRLPTKRLFGPTYGLDHRLFDGEHLKPDVRHYVLNALHGFWLPRYGPGWIHWARVYLAGSEASEWTSETLEGNNDFDVLIGVDYDRLRSAVPSLRTMSDEDITAHLNRELRELTEQTSAATIPIEGESTGPWDNTWYVNRDSWDITRIRPYAAYNITDDEWAVKPPHLPDWSIEKFPQGKGLQQEIRGIIEMAKGILRMNEPYRTRQATQLWEYIHSSRSKAFGPGGAGWWDANNVLEKALDQAGLMHKLWELMDQARRDPTRLDIPNWSNDPYALTTLG